MDYIYLGAAAIGGGWTGYLIGQFVSIKETNRRLNACVDENEMLRCETAFQIDLNGRLQSEVDRQADLIAAYQAKKPERTPDGKFASKKKRVLKELQDYVAERKAA